MTTKQIGIFLKQARENRGYSRNKLGKYADLHHQTVIAIEEGMEGYHIKNLIAYCDAVRVKIKFESEF